MIRVHLAGVLSHGVVGGVVGRYVMGGLLQLSRRWNRLLAWRGGGLGGAHSLGQ